jgi:hypothetical protein
MSETGVATVNARAHPALKHLGVKASTSYGNSTATYDLRTGVQSDASTLFTTEYSAACSPYHQPHLTIDP